ncbi:carboxypeptidase-like regulatory domain-containing protein [uncultured Jatrophihabitans sp.]|uniref:carboxypeptidase-like regulatory domain-containing protein n=1 Tax=uncultured Jatrophihabitans sp. TaxID=1610747 RepID=UPI0035C94F55
MSPIPTIRRSARNIVVAGSSLLALTAVLLFLVSPSSDALTLQAKSVGHASHGSEVLYGKFTNAAGKPIKHAHVTISKKVGNHREKVASFSTNSKGVYRKVLHRRKGVYRITVSEHVGHRTYRASKSMHLKPGHTYRVGGRITKHSVFSFLPISTY